MKIFYYIRRFWEIPGVEKHLLLKCFIISFYYILIIELYKSKHYQNLLKSNTGTKITDNELIKKVSILKKCIKRTEIIVPWKFTCLIKSLTFKTLFKQMNCNCSILFDVKKSKQGKLIAHSFIKVNDDINYLYPYWSKKSSVLIVNDNA